jgi:hypothetical protein
MNKYILLSAQSKLNFVEFRLVFFTIDRYIDINSGIRNEERFTGIRAMQHFAFLLYSRALPPRRVLWRNE